jgi:hypothetical protein
LARPHLRLANCISGQRLSFTFHTPARPHMQVPASSPPTIRPQCASSWRTSDSVRSLLAPWARSTPSAPMFICPRLAANASARQAAQLLAIPPVHPAFHCGRDECGLACNAVTAVTVLKAGLVISVALSRPILLAHLHRTSIVADPSLLPASPPIDTLSAELASPPSHNPRFNSSNSSYGR